MAKKKPKVRHLEFKRTRLNFEEIKNLIDSIDYIKIASFLWHNDYFNPARFEIYNAVKHSHSPNPKDHDFSVLARYSITKVWHKMRAKEKKKGRN